MKPNKSVTVFGSLLLGFTVLAAESESDQNTQPAPINSTAQEQGKPSQPNPQSEVQTEEVKSPEAAPVRGDKSIRLNFRGAALEQVLNYLSEAAGFIIILETEPKGKVDVWSNQPVSKQEAVDLLNTVLNKNGYAAIRNGRTLTIVKRDEAKKRDLPVKSGNDPAGIPKNEEMVTQIIPVRHANASQLSKELQPLMTTSAEMTPDETANALVITDTQANIRRMAEIIKALDDSISSTSTVHVFMLRYADAKNLANVIKELFQPAQQQGTTGNRGNQFAGGRFGGAGGFGGGGRGGNGGGGTSSSNGAANTRVAAVADEGSNSLIVAAPEDLLALITDMVDQVDQPVADITRIEVFHLVNADPTEMADMFSQLFPDESKTSNANNQQGFRFGGPFGAIQRGAAANQANSSERMKKKGQVVVVPDPRTSSIIVSAANDLMPQIEAMVAQLDSSPAKKQKVFVYSLQNADPQEVLPILQDMFQRNTTTLNRNTANQNSPLTSRIQANNQSISSGVNNGNTGLGNMGIGNGVGGGLGGGAPLR